MKAAIYWFPLIQKNDSHKLLFQALEEYLKAQGLQGITPAEAYLERPEKFGKPYIPNLPGVHCSITHSGDWWACALAAEEVGLDLQKIGERDIQRNRKGINPTRIAKRFYHPLECAWLADKEEEEFYRVWAYKESYVKYTGDGLRNGLDFFSVVSQAADIGEEAMLQLAGAAGVFQQEIPFPDKEYFLVLTTKEPAEVEIRT